jgi:hypothetical protein
MAVLQHRRGSSLRFHVQSELPRWESRRMLEPTHYETAHICLGAPMRVLFYSGVTFLLVATSMAASTQVAQASSVLDT